MTKEIWKVYPYNDKYAISNLGRVKNIKNQRVLQGCRVSRGYISVEFYRKPFLVHRLVATTFLGEIPIGHEVNHKNLIKTDNRLVNLEIVTPEQNLQHAKDNGLIVGEGNACSLFTNKQVRIIKHLFKTLRIYEIARIFNVKPDTVGAIKRGKSWVHIQI